MSKGKMLVIKGADFSMNALDKIVPPHKELNFVSIATVGQNVISPYKENANTKFEITLESPTPSKSVYAFGTDNVGDSSRLAIQIRNDGDVGVFAGVSTLPVKTKFAANTRHTITVSHSDVLLDGVSFKGDSDISYVGPEKDISIIGSNIAQNEENLNVKYYSIKQWDGENLIMDAIPVLYDGKACLYNKVTEEYIYANDGETLSFVM